MADLMSRLGRTITATVSVVVLAALGWGVLLAVRGVALGETLASGDDWRIAARWSPFGSSVTYEYPQGKTGAGGLAQPGDLSETMVFQSPDGERTYVVGVLPEGAETVRVLTKTESELADVRPVLLTDFYLASVPGGSHPIALEAVDERGEVIGRMSYEDAPSGPPAEAPHDPA